MVNLVYDWDLKNNQFLQKYKSYRGNNRLIQFFWKINMIPHLSCPIQIDKGTKAFIFWIRS